MNSIHPHKASCGPLLAAVAAIGLASAAPIGINFHGTREPGGDLATTDSGFGVPAGNWLNALATHTGNPSWEQNRGPLELTTGDGVSITVSFTHGSLFHGVTGATSPSDPVELRILNQYLQNISTAGATPGFTVTLSGLSAIPGGRYQITLIGANRDTSFGGDTDPAFDPITLTAGSQTATLTYSPLSGYTLNSGYPNAGIAVSERSPVLTSDTLTIASPIGSTTGDGLAAIIISPASDINLFDTAAELDDWEVLPIPSGTVTLEHSFDLQPRFVDDIQHTPHSEGLWSTDADADLTSGSLKIEAVHTETSGSQFNIRRNFAEPVDASAFESLELDLMFDPASTRRRFGNYSWFTVYLQYLDGEETREIELTTLNPQGSQTNSQTGGIPGSENGPEDYPNQWIWQRINADLQTEDVIPALSSITGIRISSGHSGNSAPSGVAYLDNLRFTVPETPPVDDAGPQLAIEKADSGLLLTLAAADPETTLGTGQYQNIRTVPGDYTWVGRASAENPVTYSFTIEGYPSTPAGLTGQFESHIFLVPAVEEYDWTHNPNTTHPHAVRLTLNGDVSSAWAHLAYKIDAPGNEGVYWSGDNGLGGSLGSGSRPSVYGTWSLRFTADNVVTLVSPDGAAQTWTITLPDYTGIEDAPPTVADAFAGPISVYFGSGVRDAQGLHHLEARASAIFAGISITGVPEPVDETFAGPLDPARFSLESSINPVAVIPLNLTPSPFWVSWNRAAAVGHRLQESADLATWADSETSISGPPGDRQRVFKPAWLRPAGKGFYRLTDEP